MSIGDVLAVVAAAVVAILSGALVVALISLGSALRSLRAAADLLREETLPLVAELHRAVADTVEEVERVDRIITAAEGLGDRVDGASRLAYRAFGSPVVKAMAFGAGVSQATRRLRGAPKPENADVIGIGGSGKRNADGAPAALSVGSESAPVKLRSHRRRRSGGS
jgi:hypothetical protein